MYSLTPDKHAPALELVSTRCTEAIDGMHAVAFWRLVHECAVPIDEFRRASCVRAIALLGAGEIIEWGNEASKSTAAKTISGFRISSLAFSIEWLKYVHDVYPASNKIYLVIEHEHQHYVGTLIFDERTFCHQIANLLRQHIGRLMKRLATWTYRIPSKTNKAMKAMIVRPRKRNPGPHVDCCGSNVKHHDDPGNE